MGGRISEGLRGGIRLGGAGVGGEDAVWEPPTPAPHRQPPVPHPRKDALLPGSTLQPPPQRHTGPVRPHETPSSKAAPQKLPPGSCPWCPLHPKAPTLKITPPYPPPDVTRPAPNPQNKPAPREFSVVSYTLLLSLVEFKTLVMRDQLEAAWALLPQIPQARGRLLLGGLSGGPPAAGAGAGAGAGAAPPRRVASEQTV